MNLLIIKTPVYTIGAEETAQLVELCPDLHIELQNPADITDAHLAAADAIFGWPDVTRLKLATNLRWLHTPSAGIDAYANPALFARDDVLVTRSKDVFNIQIAEHIIMLFLALSRNLATYVQSTKEGRWVRAGGQRELSGATVLIVGAGAIGNELASQLRGFHCRVLGIKRDLSSIPPHYDKVLSDQDLDTVLPEADFVALCLPRTPETNGMFDYRRFSLMKPDAVMVNIGRGEAIVSADIDRALREGLIGGAGLDVTAPEPLPEGHPLWGAPNVIITSHSSGNSDQANQRRFALFCDLWKRFVNGEPMHSLVDFSKGY